MSDIRDIRDIRDMWQRVDKDHAEYVGCKVDKYYLVKDGDYYDDDNGDCDYIRIYDDDAVDDIMVMTIIMRINHLLIL